MIKQGGFSKIVWNDAYLKKYLHNKPVFGYVGHLARRPEWDRDIESFLLKKRFTHHDIAVWITSIDGRHFADALESTPSSGHSYVFQTFRFHKYVEGK